MQKSAEDILFNKELIDEIINAPVGDVVKSASITASKATRTSVREAAFSDPILPLDPITDSELDYSPDDHLPILWCELEPDSPPAKIIPYDATPNTWLYSATSYAVIISTLSTDEATKNVNELRGYKTDVRKMVEDNLVRDLDTAKDHDFMVSVSRALPSSLKDTAKPGGASGNYTTNGMPYSSTLDPEAHSTQWVDMGATINRVSLARASAFFIERKLPLGVCLINQRTATELLTWGRNQVGGDKAEALLMKGLSALDKFEVVNMPFISTIKRELVPNGTMFQFTTAEFLGKGLMLEDVAVTIKREYNYIRFRAQMQIGRTFGNTRGIQRLDFQLPETLTFSV